MSKRHTLQQIILHQNSAPVPYIDTPLQPKMDDQLLRVPEHFEQFLIGKMKRIKCCT